MGEPYTLESGTNIPLRLLIFGIFSRGYGFITDLKDLYFTTQESGINVPPWINVASGKFDKQNKHSPLRRANLCSKI